MINEEMELQIKQIIESIQSKSKGTTWLFVVGIYNLLVFC